MTGGIAGPANQLVDIRFRWAGGEAIDELTQTVPIYLTVGKSQIPLTPGEQVRVRRGPITLTMVGPRGDSESHPVDADRSKVFDLPVAALERLTRDTAPSTGGAGIASDRSPEPLLALNVARWARTGTPIGEAPSISVALEGSRMEIRAPRGQAWTVPAELAFATRTTRPLSVAVPPLGDDETAVVDLATGRGWGLRPSLAPADPAVRVLAAYLRSGQVALGAEMARALARVHGRRRPRAWVEPGFSQLLIGYAFALSGDGPSLRAWCRRTDAERYLGSDGVLLAARASQLEGSDDLTLELLARLASMPKPLITFGIDLGISLATAAAKRDRRVDFEGLGDRGLSLSQLVTAYSGQAAVGDPTASTTSTPYSTSRQVRLIGAGLFERFGWVVRFLSYRLRADHRLDHRQTTVSVRLANASTASRPASAKGVHTMGINMPTEVEATHSRPFGSLYWLTLVLSMPWLALLFASIARPDDQALNDLLYLVSGALLVLLGGLIATRAMTQRAQGLERELAQSRQELRAREEQAMGGRALAALLQAQAVGHGSGKANPVTDHASASVALFGDLIGPHHAFIVRDAGAGADSEVEN